MLPFRLNLSEHFQNAGGVGGDMKSIRNPVLSHWLHCRLVKQEICKDWRPECTSQTRQVLKSHPVKELLYFAIEIDGWVNIRNEFKSSLDCM